MLTPRRRLLCAAVAGLALSAAFEPLALPWVVPFSVAAFALLTRGQRVRPAIVLGLVFGATFYFTHIVWMQAVGIPAWIALSLLETSFYGVLGALSAVLQRHRLWPLWFAAAWTAVEIVRSGWPLGGMPWGRLAFAVVDSPVAPALPYVGAVGVTFLLALLGALLAAVARAALTSAPVRPAALALVGLCALLALPVVMPWDGTERDDATATIAVVQGDVPGRGDDILYDYRQVTQNHADATVALAERVAAGEVPEPDFVLWPENSTATDPFDDASTNAQITEASDAIGVPILVGAIADGGPNQVLNQGIVWDPYTGAGERYTKRHPVPFGEYVPLRSVFLRYNFFDRLRDVGRDMLTGTRDEPLDVGGVSVADAICFDIAYDDGLTAQISRGAELLVVQTSNATFIRTDQIDQQFAITRVRAIETGRWTAVASTNGVSGVIAPDGSVVDVAEPRTQDVLLEQVTLIDTLTPATRIGPWSGRVAALLTVVGLLVALRGRRARTDTEIPPTQADPELVGAR
ncbi:apolipoprotein N-acyltransferase [Nocardioides sp.]|uniref:apolipoprotein N-acyltransferase n=1 Tax=Nocardioides sp. TaxID=35761 RepID=UPI001A207ECD|nr:apolipoprotein N-acyltransferase [Nocardioides sp.]MBJ7358986.1 apolipoprotein N-acyltransferase [Nocardioides sp.]